MNRLSAIMLAAAVSLGTTAMVANNARTTNPVSSEVRFATDGAFRDGLYLGRLAAQSGIASRPAVGRWSRDQDRASFVAGYRRGYSPLAANLEYVEVKQ